MRNGFICSNSILFHEAFDGFVLCVPGCISGSQMLFCHFGKLQCFPQNVSQECFSLFVIFKCKISFHHVRSLISSRSWWFVTPRFLKQLYQTQLLIIWQPVRDCGPVITQLRARVSLRNDILFLILHPPSVVFTERWHIFNVSVWSILIIIT